MPVIVLAEATPLIVSAMKSEDMGMTSAICSASAALSTSGPRKNPHTDMTTSASGNIEKSI